MKLRIIFLVILLIFGVALGTALYHGKVQPPVEPTFTSIFQVSGESVRVVDRLAGRLLPVDDLDEAALGQALKEKYVKVESDSDQYVNSLLQTITKISQKDFSYKAFVVTSSEPNAMALPGGAILVTHGLLDELENEGQLVAVLSHEVGHVELSHCIDKVKYEIAAKKMGIQSLGAIADLAVKLMLSHSFSKTQEHEADNYAWTWLTHSRYDPGVAAGAFKALLLWGMKHGKAGYNSYFFRDYFTSHPPLEIRTQEYFNRASRWWKQHPEERRYIGVTNLTQRSALGEGEGLATEWITGKSGKAATIQVDDQAEADALFEMGQMYHLWKYQKRDFAKAKEYYRLAAEQGHSGAQYNLGLLVKDVEETVYWFSLAAEKGHLDAQKKLGSMYYEGREVPHNYNEAIKWYTMAAYQSDINAQRKLGLCYIESNEDYIRAYAWLNMAAEQGSKLSKKKKDEMSQKMTSIQIAAAEELIKEIKVR